LARILDKLAEIIADIFRDGHCEDVREHNLITHCWETVKRVVSAVKRQVDVDDTATRTISKVQGRHLSKGDFT